MSVTGSEGRVRISRDGAKVCHVHSMCVNHDRESRPLTVEVSIPDVFHAYQLRSAHYRVESVNPTIHLNDGRKACGTHRGAASSYSEDPAVHECLHMCECYSFNTIKNILTAVGSTM